MVEDDRVLGVEPTVHPSAQMFSVRLGAYTEVGQLSHLEHVEMGDYSYCGEFCIFQNAQIGRFSSIAASVRIGPTMHPMGRSTQHHFTYRRRLYGFSSDDAEFFDWRLKQRVIVGHDTWIGHGATVMPNVSLGIGSVVGAGAVVTRDVPPYTIVAGVPARVLRRRFPEAVARALMAIAWWDWPHDDIRARVDDFSLPVEEFIAKHGAQHLD